MLMKLLALVLVLLIADLSCGFAALAQTGAALDPVQMGPSLSKKELKRAMKVKKLIKSLGVGPEARTEIRYTNKTGLKGHVSESTDDYFVMTDENTGATTRVEYAQVEKVMTWPTVKTLIKRDVDSPSRLFKKMAIGAGIGFGLLFAVCGITKRCQN